MITHEFEWGEDEFADDPICIRVGCDRPFSLHADRVGITHEDETLGVDNLWKDAYAALRGSDW
jgi:hypothetical protein